MKKGLFLLLAILTVGLVRVSADVAAPILSDKVIKVEVREGTDIDEIKTNIEKVNGVYTVTVEDKGEKTTCEPCEKCGTSETLSDKDITSLKNATLIIYVTLGILVVLMIIVIALMISKRKKDSKKDD